MRRRDFITLLSSAAAWPLAARAQQPGRVWRIGVLETVSQALNTTNMDAFQQGLRALGYVEGQNYALDIGHLMATMTDSSTWQLS